MENSFNKPKFYWTKHVQGKMRFYSLSQNRVKRVINNPKRIEEGIAPKTIAAMQRAGTRKRPYEIWVMIQKGKERLKIISAWRYPGTTRPRELPPEVLEELKNLTV